MFAKLTKPIVPISATLIFVAGISLLSCRVSFANDKRPDKGAVTFGAQQPPQISTPAQFAGFKTIFADLAEKVLPTVVTITSTKMDTIVSRNPFDQFFWGGPFNGFFGRPRQQQQQRDQRPQIIPRTGVGSGVIVSPDGYILTNNHVVGDADEITVELSDDRKFEAEIVGTDSLSDVAVIRIKEKVSNLPVAYLGNSDKLRPGDWVMAIGNPFNLSSTVTTGIVSALGRRAGGGISYQDFIQTDAAINPGNSGGGLFNIDGELIGINTMIYSRSGGYMGIGFAIPISMAHDIMEQLIYDGEVSRGWLGVGIQELDQTTAEAMGLSNIKGVLINDVFDGQPADKAGIKRGDIVTNVGATTVTNTNDLRNAIAAIRPGTKVPVVLLRKGKSLTLNVKISQRDEKKLGELGSSEGGKGEKEGGTIDATKMLGITVTALTTDLRMQLGIGSNTKGVIVSQVEPASVAARNGIQKKDIIMEVKGVATSTPAEFKSALKGISKGDSVLLLVRRGKNTFYVAFKIK